MSVLSEISEALRLGERSVGVSEPNPRVGCLLAGLNGVRFGIGHTQAAGAPHAEIMALRAAHDEQSAEGGAAEPNATASPKSATSSASAATSTRYT